MVNVPPRLAAALRRHAAAANPAECCGALFGTATAQLTEVRAVVPVANAATGPDRYLITAAEVLRLERLAGQVGQRLVGFYHSHPAGPAVPSTTDLEQAVPGFVYLIAALATGDLRAWRLEDDRSAFAELPLTLLAGAA